MDIITSLIIFALFMSISLFIVSLFFKDKGSMLKEGLLFLAIGTVIGICIFVYKHFFDLLMMMLAGSVGFIFILTGAIFIVKTFLRKRRLAFKVGLALILIGQVGSLLQGWILSLFHLPGIFYFIELAFSYIFITFSYIGYLAIICSLLTDRKSMRWVALFLFLGGVLLLFLSIALGWFISF